MIANGKAVYGAMPTAVILLIQFLLSTSAAVQVRPLRAARPTRAAFIGPAPRRNRPHPRRDIVPHRGIRSSVRRKIAAPLCASAEKKDTAPQVIPVHSSRQQRV